MARSAYAAVVTLLLVAATADAQSSFRLFGYVSARGSRVTSDVSWLDGGYGRFDVGPDVNGQRDTRFRSTAQIGADWSPNHWLLVHAYAVARAEPSNAGGKRAGIAEAYVELHGEKWHVRAGEFFLPTSRENTDPLWNSPYTLTYSALNTWMGEEVRPIGVDVQYAPNFYVTAGATVFRGNDTMGTLLAGRGWTFGDRIAVYDERVPSVLPKLTKPIGRDLDDENGYAARLRLQIPERALVQFTHLDNRAPLLPLVRGEEPWATKFDVVGAQIGLTTPTTVAAEWMRGKTLLNYGLGIFTMDFDTAYLLVSRKMGHERVTARVERFSTRDADFPNDDPFAREDGHAYTIAWLHEPSERLRYGLEYVKVTGGGVDPSPGIVPRSRGGNELNAEIRIKF